MEVYRREEGYVARNERKKLDMYLTYAPCGTEGGSPKDCATRLINFAQKNNFELNIKVARPYYGNRRQLRELMADLHCTVEAFTDEDYRNLAEYLGFPLQENWERPVAMTTRDEQTSQTLEEIRQGVDNVDDGE